MLSTGRRRGAARLFLATAAALGAVSARADDIAIPEIVVTPYYWPTATGKSGSTVTVISREEIERSSAGSVADLLETVPGVSVTESGGTGGQALVSLRGAEPGNTLVLIDGVRVNDPASARDEFDFSQFSITDIERIEILRGPQTALYGSDAMGGVINIITRRGEGPMHSSGVIEAGSYGTFRSTLSAGGSSGPYSVFASGTWFGTRGFSRVGDRDNGEPDGTQKWAGTLQGAYDPGGGFRFEYGLDGYRQHSDYDKSATVDASGYWADRSLVSGYGRFLFSTFDGRVDNVVSVFTTDTSRFFHETPSPTTVRNTDYQGSDTGIEYQGRIKLDDWGSLTIGTRVEDQTAFQQVTTITSGVSSTGVTYDDSRTLYAGYMLYQVPVGERLELSFAGRYDGQVNGDGFLTGRATALYDIPEFETRIHASVGTGAKRPTAFQLSYNPGLMPERSTGADLGVDRTLFDGRLMVSATGFYNRFQDLINFNGGILGGTYENISRAQTAGLELSATANLMPGVFSATATYTYLDARDLETGLPLPRRARNSGSVSLTYTGIANLKTTATATFMGRRFNDAAATVPIDGYVRIDLNSDYRVSDSLALFTRVENLFNVRYEDITGYNTSGLAAYVGARWSH